MKSPKGYLTWQDVFGHIFTGSEGGSIPVDKSQLISIIDYWDTSSSEYPPENYTPESYQAVLDAYAIAVSVRDNESATQQEVDDAYTELLNAISGLVEVEGVPAIGEFYQGGLYAANIQLDHNYGQDEGTYAIIVAMPEAENPLLAWKVETTLTANASDFRDGWANTLAMVDAGIATHPAAEHCVNWRGGGYNDWYLGSQAEWIEVYENRSVNNLWSELELPTSGGIWSSTQHLDEGARRMTPSTGGWSNSLKSNLFAVRPIRRIKLAE